MQVWENTCNPENKKDEFSTRLFVEASTGFEPVMKVLQTSALPLGHVAGGNKTADATWLLVNQPSDISHCQSVERATGFEPVAFSLARRRYTT